MSRKLRTTAGMVLLLLMMMMMTTTVFSVSAWADDSQGAEQSAGAPGTMLMGFYKTFISATDGHRCGMYPCCSSYAVQAFKKHGFFMGALLSCDRLIRCGRDETRCSFHIIQGNRRLTVDTLEDNDFWWASPRRQPIEGRPTACPSHGQGPTSYASGSGGNSCPTGK